MEQWSIGEEAIFPPNLYRQVQLLQNKRLPIDRVQQPIKRLQNRQIQPFPDLGLTTLIILASLGPNKPPEKIINSPIFQTKEPAKLHNGIINLTRKPLNHGLQHVEQIKVQAPQQRKQGKFWC